MQKVPSPYLPFNKLIPLENHDDNAGRNFDCGAGSPDIAPN